MCPAAVTLHNLFQVHPCYAVYRYFIPLLAEWYAMVWIDHILFTHLPFSGHLDYFHFLTIVNNSALNSQGQTFVDLSFHPSRVDA